MESEVKTQEVRRSAWAGQFYPAKPAELARGIAEMYARAPKPDVPGEIIGLVAPHAGYVYSGQIAANTYKLLEGHHYETVVIVSPSHTKYFSGVSVYNGGRYETPLGELPTDVTMVKRLGRAAPGIIYLSNMGHTGGDRPEHALEVQLPLLQVMLGAFKLVAIVMGDQEQWRALGDALAGAAQGRSVLLVASSDMSHYYTAEEAHRLDSAVRAAIESFDTGEVQRVIESGKGEACGAGPILACMHAARRLGADASLITGYAHSGKVSGDYAEVVGYLGAAFVRQAGRKEVPTYVLDAGASEPSLSDFDREELLRLARQTVVASVYNTALPDTADAPRSLRGRRGAFVTLKVEGQLRGCIGTIAGQTPLVDTVVRMAHAAAQRDPRFPPLRAAELPLVEIEISVLSPLDECEDPDGIEVGRHGLVLQKGRHMGVLLPQVAAENGWDRLTFLQQVALKAGLPAEAWRDSAGTLYTFEAEVF
jgi:hypothetical protein